MRIVYAGAACVLFLIGGEALFADVHVEAEETVTVVFTYVNPTATRVTIAGNFQGWNPNTHPMTKNEEGIWTYTMEASIDDVLIYKFLPDGEWTVDEGAPDFIDDGFGGLNGYVVVSEVLATQSGSGTSGGGALHFSTTVSVRSENRFLTRDLATGETAGYEFDASDLVTSSYWSIIGDILPRLELNLQLEALTGTTTLYEANTLGTEDPFTTPIDGTESALSTPFSPFTTLNEGVVRVDQLTLSYPGNYLGFRTALGTAGSTSNALIYEMVKARDANDGLLELFNGEKLQTIGGLDFGVMSGLTNQKLNGYGVYNWLTLGWEETADITVNYNIHSPEKELFDGASDYDQAWALGVSAMPTEILTTQMQYVMSFGPDNTVDLDTMAIAARTELVLEAYTGEVILKLAGDDVYTVFGDDDDLEIGLFYTEINQSTRPSDLFTVGLDYNVAMDNFGNISDDDVIMEVNPYVDLFLTDALPINLTTRVYGKTSVDLIGEATDEDRPTVFNLDEVGLEATWTEISPAVRSLTIDYGLSLEHGNFIAADDEYPLDWVYNTVAAEVAMEKNWSANAAVIIRTRGDSEDATDADVPIGLGVGASWVTPWEKINSPTLDINYTWNADPYIETSSSLYFDEDHVFRLYEPENGMGESFLRFGASWSF